MRTIERIVIGLLVAATVFAGAFWYLDRRPGSGPVVAGRSSPSAPATTSTAPPTTVPPAPTTTTTTRPGLPLPLDPAPVRIAWAGDSVAYTLAPAIAAEANARGIQVVDRSVAGCGMVRGFPADDALQPFEISRSCDASVPSRNIATGGSGADVVTWLSTWETSNRLVDGSGYVFGTPEGDATLLALIDETAQQLMAGGARLVLITMPPTVPSELRPVVPETANPRAEHLNALFAQYAAAHADRVSLLDLGAIVCQGITPCPTTVDGIVLRGKDGGHFDPAGADWAAPRILDQLVGPA